MPREARGLETSTSRALEVFFYISFMFFFYYYTSCFFIFISFSFLTHYYMYYSRQLHHWKLKKGPNDGMNRRLGFSFSFLKIFLCLLFYWPFLYRCWTFFTNNHPLLLANMMWFFYIHSVSHHITSSSHKQVWGGSWVGLETRHVSSARYIFLLSLSFFHSLFYIL